MKIHKWKDVADKRLTPERRAVIKARVAKEVLEMTLVTLRKESGLTQVEAAERTKMTQGELSRFERREDRLLSSLRKYVKALGGELQIWAVFEDKTIRLRGV